eukprot:Gb_10346 [translate_table: standard]
MKEQTRNEVGTKDLEGRRLLHVVQVTIGSAKLQQVLKSKGRDSEKHINGGHGSTEEVNSWRYNSFKSDIGRVISSICSNVVKMAGVEKKREDTQVWNFVKFFAGNKNKYKDDVKNVYNAWITDFQRQRGVSQERVLDEMRDEYIVLKGEANFNFTRGNAEFLLEIGQYDPNRRLENWYKEGSYRGTQNTEDDEDKVTIGDWVRKAKGVDSTQTKMKHNASHTLGPTRSKTTKQENIVQGGGSTIGGDAGGDKEPSNKKAKMQNPHEVDNPEMLEQEEHVEQGTQEVYTAQENVMKFLIAPLQNESYVIDVLKNMSKTVPPKQTMKLKVIEPASVPTPLQAKALTPMDRIDYKGVIKD